jgi:hypothetical protein
LGIRLQKAFDLPPAGTFVKVCTDQVSLPSLDPVFDFPSGWPLYAINRQSMDSTNVYVPWLEVWGGGTMNFSYGDGASYIELRTGLGRGGKVLYIADALLRGSTGQTLMGDAISWLTQSVLQPPLPPLKACLAPGAQEVVLSFNAQPNLDYTLEFRENLEPGPWSFLADLSGAPTNRFICFTNSITGSATRFFRLSVRP